MCIFIMIIVCTKLIKYLKQYVRVYSKIRLKRTFWDHENVFLITGVPYKRTLNSFLARDWGMKISSV